MVAIDSRPNSVRPDSVPMTHGAFKPAEPPNKTDLLVLTAGLREDESRQ